MLSEVKGNFLNATYLMMRPGPNPDRLRQTDPSTGRLQVSQTIDLGLFPDGNTQSKPKYQCEAEVVVESDQNPASADAYAGRGVARGMLGRHAEAAAASWLGDHSTAADVVLASTEFANPLAGVIDGRVVHGHIVATLHSDDKQALVQRFFSADATPSLRSQMLGESLATVVAFGPRERALGASDLSSQPDLTLIYDQDGVQLYRVSA